MSVSTPGRRETLSLKEILGPWAFARLATEDLYK